MRILWVSHLVPYPPKAGVLLRSHYLVKELARHHQVDLLAFAQKGLLQPYFPTVEEGLKRSQEEMEKICGRVKFFDCPIDGSRFGKIACALRSLVSTHPYNINWLQSEAFGEELLSWHRENPYDLIHFDTISLVPYIAGLSNVALALDHHNVESHMLLRRASLESNPLKKIYFWQEGKRLEAVERKYCPRFDINITCSDLDTERFQSIVPEANFHTVPNGVDTQFFKPSSEPPKSNRLIFIGTLDWYPNTRAVQYLAHKIWPLLRIKFPDLEVDIIGSKPPEDLLSLAKQDARFHVHGFVDDLMPYLRDATIYICPINDGGGTKLKVLDAFAAGKAVVADPIACEGLRVTNNLNVLFANTPEAYVDAVSALLANPEQRKFLEENARDHAVNNFSFASIGKALADLYQQVYESKNRQSAVRPKGDN